MAAVTTARERQPQWQATVWAFRTAAGLMKNPAPKVFGMLEHLEAVMEALSGVLPLKDFSPFGQVPHYGVAKWRHSEETVTESKRGLIPASRIGQGSRRYAKGQHEAAGQPAGKLCKTLNVSPTIKTPATVPVISFFRPRGEPDRNAFTLSGAQASPCKNLELNSQDEKREMHASGAGNVTEPCLPLERRDPGRQKRLMGAASAPKITLGKEEASEGALLAWGLLDGLADSLKELPRGNPLSEKPKAVPTDKTNSGPTQNIDAYQEAGRSFRLLVEVPRYAPPTPTAPSCKQNQPIFGNPLERGQSDLAQANVVCTMHRIDSLTREILAAEGPNPTLVRSRDDFPASLPPWRRQGGKFDLPGNEQNDCMPGSGDRTPWPWAEAVHPLAWEDPFLLGERLASLINEALVCQARRHGVDLT